MEYGFFPSNLVSTYYKVGMSYAKTDTHDAGKNPFYRGSGFNDQHLEPLCQCDDAVAGASDDPVSLMMLLSRILR